MWPLTSVSFITAHCKTMPHPHTFNLKQPLFLNVDACMSIYTHLHELKDKVGTRQRRSTPLHYYCLSKNQHHLKRHVCNTSLNKCFTELMSFDFIYDALLWQEINWDNITCNKHGIAVRAIGFWPITNLSQFCLCTLPQETLVIS